MTRRHRVLVIDDDVLLRRTICALLERENFEVIEAGDGHQGVRQFQTDPTDLVITDIVMPEQEGLETISQIRATRPDIKIIAMSGAPPLGDSNYLSMAEKFGADRTLRKPFRLHELVKVVRDLLPLET